DDVGPCERLVLAIEVADKRQVHRRLARPVQIDAHMSFLGRGRPDSPDAARALHLGEHLLVALLADDAVAIAVGIPVNVFAGPRIVAAPAVVTRPLGALLARRRRS